MTMIAISVSKSPDLALNGFGDAHLMDAMVEIARHVLATGARIAYGGDLREEGFTEALGQLVRAHNRSSGKPMERIMNYLAWPIPLEQSAEDKKRLEGAAYHPHVRPPPDLQVDPTKRIGRATVDDLYMRARGLTWMRELMTKDMHARIALGGKLDGFTGLFPGIAEEVYLAMNAEKPVYLLGAFGGSADAVIDALLGDAPSALTRRTCEQHVDKESKIPKAKLFEEYQRHGRDEVQRNLVAYFNERGISGLNNGLDENENRILFETDDLMTMIGLVMEGLRRKVFADAKG